MPASTGEIAVNTFAAQHFAMPRHPASRLAFVRCARIDTAPSHATAGTLLSPTILAIGSLMTDTDERAQRIADAVLTAKPPAPAGSTNPSQAEQALAPIRQLMLSLAQELDARRAVASITALEPRDIAGQFRTEEYSLHANTGRHRILRIGFGLKMPGRLPCLTLHGLDQPGHAQLASLVEDGRIPAHYMDQVLDVLERFLIRFLSGVESAQRPLGNPVQTQEPS